MKLRVAAESDPGLVRIDNEDSVLSSLPLVAVADGVGGQNAGEVASAMAIEVLTEWEPRLRSVGPTGLRDAAIDANRRIYTRAQGDKTLHGMATTLTAAWIHAGSCTIAHIGDSRAYLLREGELRQLTEDQTVVNELLQEGRITEDEAFVHPWRNLVVQAVGGMPDVVVEMLDVELQVGDRLMLVSDGLTDLVRDAEIRDELLANRDPEEASRTLVQRAKEAGGKDNITVVLVDVTGNDGPLRGRVRRLFARLARRR